MLFWSHGIRTRSAQESFRMTLQLQTLLAVDIPVFFMKPGKRDKDARGHKTI
jgi:hypothetical protein